MVTSTIGVMPFPGKALSHNFETIQPDTPCSKFRHDVSPSGNGRSGMLLMSYIFRSSAVAYLDSKWEEDAVCVVIFYCYFCIHRYTTMGIRTFLDVILETSAGSMLDIIVSYEAFGWRKHYRLPPHFKLLIMMNPEYHSKDDYHSFSPIH